MANTLKIKRGAAATIPQGQLAEPLFTTDTYDLYIGKGSGGNQRFQKYITSGTSSQFLKGDGSLDSTTYQSTSEKGQNNGYASLDAGGKIPVSQLPSSVIEYKGTWNASTNTPTLADGTGDPGDVYIVNVGGTQNLGSGNITFDAGDWVMYNGSVWQKSTGSNAVASVNGQTGIVVLDTDDISEDASPVNLWFTNERARTAISLTTTGNSGMATYNNMTGVLNVPNYSISGLGGVPTSRTLTINGTAYDLSADRTWSVGTVTSVAALTIGTTGTDITSTVATGTTTPVITLNIPTASATNRGALSSADWSTFNGKQAQLNGTGFVKASGTTISYDNSSYLSLAGGTMTGQIVLKESSSSTDYSKGLKFPDNAFGGAGDVSGLRLYSSSGENQVLELYVGNDGGSDTINFRTGVGGVANNDAVTINGNKIWNAGNLTPQSQLNGTGFVKATGTTISYDNSTYLLQSDAISTYLPLAGGIMTGQLQLRDGGLFLNRNYNNATIWFAGVSDENHCLWNDYNGGPSSRVTASGFDGIKWNTYRGIYLRGGFGGEYNCLVIENSTSGTNDHTVKLYASNTLRFETTTVGATVTGALTSTSTSTATAFIPTGSSIPTNGMYLPSANTLGLSANSTKVIEISDSGRMSIGATSPTADTLTVHGAITTTNGGKITAAGQIQAGSTISGSLNAIFTDYCSAAQFTPTSSTAQTNSMYLPAANTLGFSTNSQQRLTISTTAITALLPISGTSATFSGNVRSNNFQTNDASNGAFGINQNGDDTTAYRFFQFSTSGTTYVINTQMGSQGQYDIWQFSTAAGWNRNFRMTTTGAATFSGNIAANSPAAGNTGEGIIAGRSFKIDASGTGQSAKMYVVSNQLSNTYGSALQIQFANLADDKGFGFNLNTSGWYETYIKNASNSWVNAMSITQEGNILIGGNANAQPWMSKALKIEGSRPSIDLVNNGIGTLNTMRWYGGVAGKELHMNFDISASMWILRFNSYFLSGGSASHTFNGDGSMSIVGALTQNTSDSRIKLNKQIISKPLDKISKLSGITFEWDKEIVPFINRKTDIGVIAQEVQSVLPDAVTLAPFDIDEKTGLSKSGKNYLTVYYEKIIPLLIEGIKELKTELDILKLK